MGRQSVASDKVTDSTGNIRVEKKGNIWRIVGRTIQAQLNEETFALKILTRNKIWQTDPEGKQGISIACQKTCFVPFSSCGPAAFRKYTAGYGQGVEICLNDFKIEGQHIPLQLKLLVWLEEPTNNILFQIIPLEELAGVIKDCHWPGPFVFTEKRPDSYTVIPEFQGMLIPNNWEQKIELADQGHCYSRGMYMPWWGQVAAGAGYMVIYETPWNAGSNLLHPAGGPTSISPVWYPSLGKMAYNRSIIYIFFDNATYVTFAKCYRNMCGKRAG